MSLRMVSLMAIHHHVISQGPGKGCGALFSTVFNILINSREILHQQGQDPRSPIHGREHGVSLHSSLQRVQRDLQEPYSWGFSFCIRTVPIPADPGPRLNA